MPKPVAKRGRVVDLEENRLIEEAKTGNLEAYEKLYRAHVGRVYAICLRVSGDPGKAEEFTQDAFIRVWEKIRSYEGRSAFSSWLYRVATNISLDGIRREIRRSNREFEVEEPASWETPRLEAGPSGLDLESAIAALPAGARTVFVLHEIEGYTHDEIAEFTGMAAGSSKAQLHRARKLLQGMLG